MRRFNTAMQVFFSIIAFLGIIGVCSVNDSAPNWIEVLFASFFVALIGIIGCLIFANPAKFVKYAVGLLIVVLAAIYEFCHELKQCMKCASNYKKRYGTYEKTYRRACNRYYRNNSIYRYEEDDYVFDDHSKRGR